AGLHLRLAAGQHVMQTRPEEGAAPKVHRIRLAHGSTHLFAPAHDDHCFWLETEGYGKAHRGPGNNHSRLLPPGEFWVLPDDVDAWFRKAPPTPEDGRSTGGSLTALRHAPCADRGARAEPPL